MKVFDKLILSGMTFFSMMVYLPASQANETAQGKQLYEQSCASCHDRALQGAPRPNAPEDWQGRSLDIDVLAQSTIAAPAHMPAKGGTDMSSIGELKQIIAYMINDVKATAKGSTVDAALYQSRMEGKKLYALHCFSCHDSGENNSPMLGHLPDWEARLKLGRDALIDSVIAGKGMMIPMGGSTIESREKVGNLVDYMVSTVQDEAIQTSPAMQAKVTLAKQIKDGQLAYNQMCFSCHNTGENGTPRLGDNAAWQVRHTKPINELVDNVIKGHGLMPPKGGTETDSRAKLESIVRYMLSTTDKPTVETKK